MVVTPKAGRSRCWSEERIGATVLRIFTTCSAESADCSMAITDKQWFRVVCLCCAVAIINSIDRTAMSIAILPMGQQYKWSDTDKGAVSSAFNLGHTISNFCVGSLLAGGNLTPKTVLNWGVITWSLFTLLTPLAAATTWLPLLVLVRALMGLGEGVAFPTMQAIIKGWVPPDKRSRSLSLIYSGHQIGSILSLLISPCIIGATGISSLFYIYGALGFMWLSIWDPSVSHHPPKAASDAKPEDAEENALGEAMASPNTMLGSSSKAGSANKLDTSKGFNDTGRASTNGSLATYGSVTVLRPLPGASQPQGGLGARASGSGVPYRLFMSNKCFWALLWAHTVFGIGYSFFIAWLPTYYNQAFGVDLKQSSWLSIFPFLMMALGTNMSGWLADMLINSKVLSPTKARKLLQGVGNLGPATCLMYLAVVPQKGYLLEAVMLLTVSMMTLGLQAGGFASTHTDISTRYASALFGITNAGASLGGLVFVYLVGVILDHTGSWSVVFQFVAAVNFSSAAIYIMFATSEPQFE